MVEEQVEQGFEVADEAVTPGVVGDLLGAETADECGVDVHLSGGSGAQRREQPRAAIHQRGASA